MLKKILIVGLEPFLPVKSGSNKVIFEYCRLLKSLGCELHYCNTYNTTCDESFIRFMDGNVYVPNYVPTRIENLKRRLNNKISSITYRKKHKTDFNTVDELCPGYLSEYIRQLNNEHHFDICIVNYIIISKVLEDLDIKKRVLFTHDAFTYKKELLGLNDFWFNLEPNEEAKGIRRATDILSIQENEAVLFHYYNPRAHVYTVFSPFLANKLPISGNNNILLLSGNNKINQNGVDYFLKEVFPIILATNANAKLVVGGTICNYLKDRRLENIELLGYIDDPARFYTLGDVAINPIYQGTGLKIKTFEALSYGRVTVVHPHSAEGMYCPSESPLLVGNDKIEFAQHIIKVLSDRDYKERLSSQSIYYIEKMNNHITAEYKRLLDF